MNNNDFAMLLKVVLEKSGAEKDYNKLKKELEKNPAKINTILDTAATKSELNKFIKEFAPQLQKMFKDVGVKIDLKDVESSMRSVFNGINKEVKQATKEQENLVNAMAKGREQAELQAKAEEKRLQLAQNNAINKSLEQEYVERKKINDEIQKQIQQGYTDLRKNAYQSIGTKSSELTDMSKYYEEQSKQADAFYSKNLNAIDLEIKKREEDAKLFSSQLQAQMLERIQAEKEVQLAKTKTAKTTQDAINLTSSKAQFGNQVASYLKENSKLSSDLKYRLLEIRKSIDSVDDSNALKNLRNQFREVSSEARSLGQTGANTFEKFTHNLGEFTTFLSAGTLIMSGVNAIRAMVSTVVELDKAFVDLQMATGGTNEETKKLLSTYIDMGQQLGASGAEVAAAASSWLKQGKSIADTNTLIKDSMILSKIGSLDSANATKYLTTITKAYGISVEDTLSVVDKLSKVDLISATDVGGLASSLNQVSSNAQSLGVSLDELLGYVAAIGEVSGEEMSAVGNSLNTMFSRMANIKLKRLVDPETNEDLSNTETSLRRVGIQLREDSGTFRDFSDVLTEVAEKWGSYNDVTKQSIAASIAGVDHINDFKILMGAFGKATEYTSASLDSSGTAMEKFSSYTQSVEAKTKILQASLEELATDTLNSGVVKGFLDVSNVLINATDKVGIFNLAIVALLTTMNVKKGTVLIGFIDSLIAKMGLATGTATTLSFALSAIIPTALILGGLTAIIKAYDYFNVTLEEQQEITQQLQSDYEGLQSQLESTNTELQTTVDRINELNSKDNLTFVEQQELEDLKETNRQLQTNIDLLKKQSEYKNQELNQSIKDEFEKKYGSESKSDHWIQEAGMAWYDKSKFAGTEGGYVDYQIERLKELNSIKTKGNELTKDEQKEYEKISKYLTDVGVDYASFASRYSVDDKTKQSWLDMADLINKTLSPGQYNTNIFNEVFDSKTFSKAKEELLELASAGKLSEDTISSNESYKELINNTGLTAKDVTTQIYALSDSLKESGDSSENAYISTKSYKEILDSVSKNVKLVTEAQYELSDSGKINSDTVSDLLEAYPELADKLILTEDGYTTTNEALQGLIDSQINEYQLAYNDAVDACNKFIDNEKLKQAGIDATTTSIKDQMYAMLKLYEAQGQASGDTLREIQNQPTYQNMLSAWMNVGTTEKNLDTATKVTKQIQKETTDELKEKDKKKTTKKDAYLEAANADIDTLKHNLAMGKITEEKYYSDLEKLNNKYFKGKSKYLDEYRKYEEEIYTGQKKLEENALDERTKAIKSEFDLLEHKYNSGKITEADYQKQRWELAKKYYWKNSEYLSEWQKEIENHHKWVVESEAETNKKRVENLTNTNSTIIDSFKSVISDTMDDIDDFEGESQIQFNKIADAINIAKNEATYLKQEMTNLDKLLKDGKISSSDYTNLMKDLNSAMDDTKDTVKDLEDKMSKVFKSENEKVLDDLKDAYDAQTEALNKQKDAYDEIIDAQLELLNAEKKRHDYEESIAEKTKKVSDIQSRMAELQKAANSGDRTAAKELKELQDDLAKAQKDLDETQYDHRIDLQEDSYNKSKKSYDDLKDKELENVKSVYNTKIDNLKKLYAEEEKLIARASQYTKTEFASQITALNTQISEIITQINSAVSGNVGGVSSGTTQGIINNQASLVDVGVTPKSTSLTSTQKAEVLSILKNGTGAYYGDKSSALNKYVYSKYKTALSYGQMVSVAKTLGVPNIKTNADVTGNETNTNAILEALQKAQFSTGGVVGGTSNNYVKQLTGEDGLGLMRIGEGILKPKETDAVINFGNHAPEFIDTLNTITSNALSPNNYTTNNNNTPNISMELNISGNATPETVSNLKSVTNDIVNQVSDKIMKNFRIR